MVLSFLMKPRIKWIAAIRRGGSLPWYIARDKYMRGGTL
jgi:hypothetical protein